MVKPLPPTAVEPPEAVRYMEVIRAYQIGRYVDPNHPDVRHEQHPLYRVEVHSRWNLTPRSTCPPGVSSLNPAPDSAYSPALTNDVILAELNRQKDATERVMRQATILAKSYDELQAVLKDMPAAAQNQVLMGARIANAERRVAQLEKEVQCATHTATNEVPSFVTEQPDSTEP
jgi:hypothetical protein